MSQLIKPQIKWTPEKIELLKLQYPLGDKQSLADSLGIKRSTLKYAAKRFGIKSELDRRKYKAKNLFDDSLESYYWHGFIMADGHISYRNSINIVLSEKDKDHLLKFEKFLKCDTNIKTKHSTHKNYSNGTYSSLYISDVDTCDKFRGFYQIGNTKTVNPPNLERLIDDEKFLSFFIGLFDGDGCFDHTSKSIRCMKIECHQNWYDLFLSIQIRLETLGISSTLKVTKRGFVCFRIYKIENFCKFKNFIMEKSLPVLNRKWNIIHI